VSLVVQDLDLLGSKTVSALSAEVLSALSGQKLLTQRKEQDGGPAEHGKALPTQHPCEPCGHYGSAANTEPKLILWKYGTTQVLPTVHS